MLALFKNSYLVVGLLALVVILVVMNKDKVEKFGTDYFHLSEYQPGDSLKTNEELKKMNDAYVKETFKYKESFENDVDASKIDYTETEAKGDDEMAGFDPSNYVISNYSTQDVKPDASFHTDVVEYTAPELYYEETGNYSDLSELKKEGDDMETHKMESAFHEVQTDSFYKDIESIKLRGGNRS